MATWLNTALDILNRLNRYSGGNLRTGSNQTYPEVKIDTTDRPKESNNYMTLDLFNSVEYDGTHLWALTISGAPAPFHSWFPAQSIDEITKGASTTTMSFGIDEINLLNSYNALSMRVEMLDSEGILESWLKAWQKRIATDPTTNKPYIGFRYLDDILTTMTVAKYNWQKKKLSVTEYYVLPSGQISLNRQNDPSVKVLTVNFAVFGSKELDS